MFKLPHAFHIWNNNGKKETIDTFLVGSDSYTWWKAVGNKLWRLANGLENQIRVTNTIKFIINGELPSGCTVTYANFVCNYRPLKSELFIVILTIGGQRLEYPDDATSPAVSLLGLKLLFNSTISDAYRSARFLLCDLKDFLLETPMSRSVYMRIHSKHFPPDIITLYQIDGIISKNWYFYIKTTKGMCGLKKAATIACKQFIAHMEHHEYYSVPFTTGLWYH